MDDLRLSTDYASRVGLLSGSSVLATLQSAEESIETSNKPDIYSLTLALNEVTKAIAPITLADLKFGRNPLDNRNQRAAQRLQLFLAALAISILAMIGYSMHALRQEQSAILTLEKVQNLRPLAKAIQLRKMAQYENPTAAPNALYDQYHQLMEELLEIKDQIQNSYMQAVTARDIPIFPLQWLANDFFHPLLAYFNPIPEVSTPHAAAQTPAVTNEFPENNEFSDICIEDAQGGIKLSKDSMLYPNWIRTVLSDTLNDFCFQLKVLSPNGDGALVNQNFSAFAFKSQLDAKVTIRKDWFLPFFYGLLGSVVFLMRDISSVRTPTMRLLSVLTRIALGGVAGIVIVWFSSAAGTEIQEASAVSLPFALAFLIGYGIDALFGFLDRVSRTFGLTTESRGDQKI